MNDGLDLITRKILRGDILKALEVSKGEEMGAMTLDAILGEAGHQVRIPDIKLQCQYLAEKGYISLRDTERQTFGITIFLARLTSKGLDLLEGSIPDDPGITLKD